MIKNLDKPRSTGKRVRPAIGRDVTNRGARVRTQDRKIVPLDFASFDNFRTVRCC